MLSIERPEIEFEGGREMVFAGFVATAWGNREGNLNHRVDYSLDDLVTYDT